MSVSSMTRRSALWQVAAVAAAASLLSAGCAVSVPANIQPVRNFEATKYMGQWYEIARIDHRFQKGLTQAEAHYALNDDGTVQVINRGFNAEKNTWKAIEGKAKFLGDPSVGALKVSFFGPFYGGYNIVDLDPAYQTALVIGEDTSYFWLLSRKPDMPKEQLQQWLHKAQAMGVDLNQVIMAR